MLTDFKGILKPDSKLIFIYINFTREVKKGTFTWTRLISRLKVEALQLFVLAYAITN